jgi:hypothetical protein
MPLPRDVLHREWQACGSGKVASGVAALSNKFQPAGHHHDRASQRPPCNLDKPTTVVLDLVKLRAGWRIADINWGRKPTLRGLFAKR